jgi:putative transcriptional regulator
MTGKKAKGNPRVDEALLELAQTFRGTLLTEKTADRITMRILGGKPPAKPAPLEPEEIRAIREEAQMSQAVFAAVLNVTAGYLSKLERGAIRPAGPALALLDVMRRKGVAAVL